MKNEYTCQYQFDRHEKMIQFAKNFSLKEELDEKDCCMLCRAVHLTFDEKASLDDCTLMQFYHFAWWARRFKIHETSFLSAFLDMQERARKRRL